MIELRNEKPRIFHPCHCVDVQSGIEWFINCTKVDELKNGLLVSSTGTCGRRVNFDQVSLYAATQTSFVADRERSSYLRQIGAVVRLVKNRFGRPTIVSSVTNRPATSSCGRHRRSMVNHYVISDNEIPVSLVCLAENESSMISHCSERCGPEENGSRIDMGGLRQHCIAYLYSICTGVLMTTGDSKLVYKSNVLSFPP